MVADREQTNGTITSSIVTGGAEGRGIGGLALGVVLIPFFWR